MINLRVSPSKEKAGRRREEDEGEDEVWKGVWRKGGEKSVWGEWGGESRGGEKETSLWINRQPGQKNKVSCISNTIILMAHSHNHQHHNHNYYHYDHHSPHDDDDGDDDDDDDQEGGRHLLPHERIAASCERLSSNSRSIILKIIISMNQVKIR